MSHLSGGVNVTNQLGGKLCRRCGKYGYATKAKARRASQALHPGNTDLEVYQCGQRWHYGRPSVTPAACPTPAKPHYGNETKAYEAAQLVAWEVNVFECPCGGGWCHARGRKGRGTEHVDDGDRGTTGESAEDGAEQPDERLVLELAGTISELPDEAFHAFVLRHLDGYTKPAESAALFTSRTASRFAGILTTLIAEHQARVERDRQARSPAAENRRRRTQALIDRMGMERKEARRIASEAAVRSPEEKAQRRAAGWESIQRLIDAHREEFDRYMLEELQAQAEGRPLHRKPTPRRWVTGTIRRHPVKGLLLLGRIALRGGRSAATGATEP